MEKNTDWLPLASPKRGAWPATQACVLTGNQTNNLLVLRLVPARAGDIYLYHYFEDYCP